MKFTFIAGVAQLPKIKLIFWFIRNEKVGGSIPPSPLSIHEKI